MSSAPSASRPALRYIVYARKSSEEKTKQVQSIEDQINALHSLIRPGGAGDNGLTVTHVLTESRSAKAPGRPVFDQMIDLLQKGEADAILCWHLNRLTRNEIDSGTLRWLLRHGIIQEIRTPHRTYRPEDNALVTAVESAMGEQFIVELKESTRRGVLSKVEKGWFPGRVPQGYKNDLLTHTIVRDNERWPALQRAWQEMLTGRATVPQIAGKLGPDWGYRAPGNHGSGRSLGDSIARTTLYHLFSNPFYAGVFVWEGKLYPGKHEPMVTMGEWEEVQRLLHRRSGKPEQRRQKRVFAFSGMIVCAHCGKTVCADRKRKVMKYTGEEKFHTYYACSHVGKGCKVSGRVREEVVEQTIREHLSQLSLPEDYLQYAREVTQRWREEERGAEEALRASQARALADTERQLEELLTLRLRGLVDDGIYQARRERLNGERNTVLRNAQTTTEVMDRAWETVEAVADYCVHAEERFTRGDVATKGLIARQLGAVYKLEKGRILVEMNGLLGLVREHNKKTILSPQLLEPAESGSGKDEQGGSTAGCQGWGDLLDSIRTAVVQDKGFFQGLSQLQTASGF